MTSLRSALRERIELLEADIQTLRAACDVLDRHIAETPHASDRKKAKTSLLPAPDKAHGKTRGRPPRKSGDSDAPVAQSSPDRDREFVVGGRTVRLDLVQASMMDLLVECPEGEFVSGDRLKSICNDDLTVYQRELRQLRDKLEAVGSTVEGVRGAGFRLAKVSK